MRVDSFEKELRIEIPKNISFLREENRELIFQLENRLRKKINIHLILRGEQIYTLKKKELVNESNFEFIFHPIKMKVISKLEISENKKSYVLSEYLRRSNDELLDKRERQLVIPQINPDRILTWCLSHKEERIFLEYCYRNWNTERKVNYWRGIISFQARMNSGLVRDERNSVVLFLDRKFKEKYGEYDINIEATVRGIANGFWANSKVCLKLIDYYSEEKEWIKLSFEA